MIRQSTDQYTRVARFRILNLNKLTKEGVEYGAYLTAVQLRRRANTEILRKPKHGRIYVRRDRAGRRRRHRASSPREIHANDRGALRRSLGFDVSRLNIYFGFGIQARNPAPRHAPFIEYGTFKMAARRSIGRTIDLERRNVQNNFDEQIGRRLGMQGVFET